MHTNKINGKKYIGITSNNVNVRWKNGYGYSDKLPIGRAIRKYGWDNFEHIIVEDGLDEESAKNLEMYLIEKNQTTDDKYGYNLTAGGDGITGFVHSDESKQKMSEKAKNRNMFGKNNPNFGNRWSDEQREAASVSKRRENISPETLKKMSDSAKKRVGELNSFYGKHHSDETKKKLSEIAKSRNMFGENNPNYGRKWSDEQKEKHSAAHRKENLSPETLKKMSDAAKRRTSESKPFFGMTHSDKTKALISKANSRPVDQFDLDMSYIATYKSMKDAGEKNSLTSASISNCCRGISKTAGGYIWAYSNKEIDNDDSK